MHGTETKRLKNHEFEGAWKEIAAVGSSGHALMLAPNTYFENRYSAWVFKKCDELLADVRNDEQKTIV
jgi:hypothetical protein